MFGSYNLSLTQKQQEEYGKLIDFKNERLVDEKMRKYSLIDSDDQTSVSSNNLLKSSIAKKEEMNLALCESKSDLKEDLNFKVKLSSIDFKNFQTDKKFQKTISKFGNITPLKFNFHKPYDEKSISEKSYCSLKSLANLFEKGGLEDITSNEVSNVKINNEEFDTDYYFSKIKQNLFNNSSTEKNDNKLAKKDCEQYQKVIIENLSSDEKLDRK